jgi:hypothetical protein
MSVNLTPSNLILFSVTDLAIFAALVFNQAQSGKKLLHIPTVKTREIMAFGAPGSHGDRQGNQANTTAIPLGSS